MLPAGVPRRSEVVLTLVIAGLAIPVHIAGLMVPTLYRDPAILMPQNLGTDLVTVALMIPLFGFSCAVMGRWPRARLLWLGSLGYFAYAYGIYALGVHWNRLFLAYVALFGLSFYGLLFGLARTPVHAIAGAFTPRTPVRATAMYLTSVAILVAAIWLVDEIGATATGVAPPLLTQVQLPTNIVHVFDLGLVLPALLGASLLLVRRRPWGYVLAGVLLVKTTAIGIWVVAMLTFSAMDGFPEPIETTAFFVLLTLIGVGVSWRYLLALDPARETAAIGSHSERAA